MAQKSAAAVKRSMAPTSVTAKDIMQSPVVAATPLASLRDVATQLVTNECSGMPVAASDAKVIGVITESDVVRTLIEGKRLENLTAGDVMTGPPITVNLNTPIEDVMQSLQENSIVRVPVTDLENSLGSFLGEM